MIRPTIRKKPDTRTEEETRPIALDQELAKVIAFLIMNRTKAS